MKLTAKQYAQALHEAISQTKDHDIVLDNFVKILAQNGDLSKHPEIEKEYKLIEMHEKGIKEVGVTVAKDLEVNEKLISELNEVVGKKIQIKKEVDEGIVGGVVIRVDDTLIDASVKTQLNNLNEQLKNS